MGLNAKSAVYAVGGIVLLAMLVLVAVVTVPGIIGGDDAYIVTSGSMQPTIGPGDVVVTKDVSPDEIERGDVVTFNADSNTDRGYVTHRVVELREENGEQYFKTKGDANDDPDPGYVPASAAHGVQHLHIPYLGYLLLFARSTLGLVALIILPGLGLVASGSMQLLREFGYVTDAGVLAALRGADSDDGPPPALEGETEMEPVLQAGVDDATALETAIDDATDSEGDQ